MGYGYLDIPKGYGYKDYYSEADMDLGHENVFKLRVRE
jgi:hypothetical protein